MVESIHIFGQDDSQWGCPDTIKVCNQHITLYLWAMLVVFVPATANSYAHCGEIYGYATNTQGDVRISTSTELRGCVGKHQDWGMWTVRAKF